MRFWRLACLAAAFAASPLCVTVAAKLTTDQSVLPMGEGARAEASSLFVLPATPATFSQRFSLRSQDGDFGADHSDGKEADAEPDAFAFQDRAAGAESLTPSSSDSTSFPEGESPSDKKPADLVLAALSDIPVGTPVEEIKLAADAFGLDFRFMEAMAKIESDFDPNQRTGSYIGLFQLSKSEFRKYGSGNILSPRDNAVAAASKLAAEAEMFELHTHREPTIGDLYLIHQQGWRGAAEHLSHPERVAWKSMCATEEGRSRGEAWCKRAIWGNTLPTVKHDWKSVNKLTSDAFVSAWRQRLDQLYSRYAKTDVAANDNRANDNR
jgi:hypothetical protein